MKDRIKELEAEIARLKIVEKWFGEIMAVIHGDGGHYYCDHGPIKACKDAKKKFWELVTIKESSQEMISAQGTDIINLRKRLNKAEIARDGWMKNYDLEKAALSTAQTELAEAKEDIAKIGDSLTKTIEDRNTCRGKLRGLENQLIVTNTELATLRKVVGMMEKGEWGYKSVASNDATFWYINNIDAKAANLDIAKMKEGMEK